VQARAKTARSTAQTTLSIPALSPVATGRAIC
jgi:hypothetical protein